MEMQRQGDTKRVSLTVDLGVVTVRRSFPSSYEGNVSKAYRNALRLHREASASGNPSTLILKDLRRNGSLKIDDRVQVITAVKAKIEKGALSNVTADVEVLSDPPHPPQNLSVGPKFVGPKTETKAGRVEVTVVAPDEEKRNAMQRLIDSKDYGDVVTVARLQTPKEGFYTAKLQYLQNGKTQDTVSLNVKGWAGRGQLGEMEGRHRP